jgi:signal transduction histidine kinase
MTRGRRPLLQYRWVRWVLILGLWTFLGVFDAYQSYALVRMLDKPIMLEELLALSLAEWYIWAALAPVVAALGQRYPLEQKRWPQRLALLLAASMLVAALKVVLDFPVELALRLPYTPAVRSETPEKFFQFLFMARYMGYLMVCWAILGTVHALEYYAKYRRREREASALGAELARAQLQVLKMQLHPHFLFNTLNAVSALVHKDVELADRMIARLGDLLRLTLDNAGAQEVPLQQELDFVELYLEIEKARLGPRLRVEFHIDAEARDASIPNLILQPLVENAVCHAIAPYSRPGCIEVSAWRNGRFLHLQVRDDGPGLLSRDALRASRGPSGGVAKEGLGLANTRARLSQLYGANHRFEMTSQPGKGLAVTLTLPFRSTADEEPAPMEPEDEDTCAHRR